MLSLLAALSGKVFVFIALGYALNFIVSGERGARLARLVADVALYGLIPLYLFLTMWTGTYSLSGAMQIALVAAIVMAACAVLVLTWSRVRKVAFRERCLPVVFMNSAYLAIPVSALLWGPQGVTATIVFNFAVTLAHFTVGIGWVSRRKPFAEIFKLPVIYAVTAGFLLNRWDIVPPVWMQKPAAALSTVTLAVMLIFVGYRLVGVRREKLKAAALGVFLRMGGGWAAAAAAVYLLHLDGPAAGVCVMVSAMPAAVNAYILAERYDSDPGFSATAVVLGTAASVATIPLLGYIYAF